MVNSPLLDASEGARARPRGWLSVWALIVCLLANTLATVAVMVLFDSYLFSPLVLGAGGVFAVVSAALGAVLRLAAPRAGNGLLVAAAVAVPVELALSVAWALVVILVVL